jgi:hypothetical protein
VLSVVSDAHDGSRTEPLQMRGRDGLNSHVLKREPQHTLGQNIDWYRYYGKQHRNTTDTKTNDLREGQALPWGG